MMLQTTPVVPGGTVTLRATGAPSGATVFFVRGSAAGAGT
jgi:hypothetical protein